MHRLTKSPKNWRRPLFFLAVATLLFLASFHALTHPALPSPQDKIIFYSTQLGQDLKRLFKNALESAREEIVLSIYGLTDPAIIETLKTMSEKQLPVYVCCDSKASDYVRLQEKLPLVRFLQARHRGGLMHQKLLIVDRKSVFLGSANLTKTSLRFHANLVAGLYCPTLARQLCASMIEGPSKVSSPPINVSDEVYIRFYWLPEQQKIAYEHLLSLIQGANKHIFIALFNLSEPTIAQELIAAHQRGVKVEILLDRGNAAGASRTQALRLEAAGVQVRVQVGPELMHHKCAWIDEKTLWMGSANWTKAAFKSNQEFIALLSPLPKASAKQCQTLRKQLLRESRDYTHHPH